MAQTELVVNSLAVFAPAIPELFMPPALAVGSIKPLYPQEGLQKFPLNSHLLTLEADYHNVADKFSLAETALQKAFAANPRQDWVAIRLAKTLERHGKSDQAKDVLTRCLQVNPTSKRAHFELAAWYASHASAEDGLILDHLRRSFTTGDKNFEAKFLYARKAFLMGNTGEASQIFADLWNAEISPQLRQQVREMITDEAGRDKVFIGEVMKDRKSTRLNSSHTVISYAVFCLKKKKKTPIVDNRPDTNNRAPHDLVVSDSPDAL